MNKPEIAPARVISAFAFLSVFLCLPVMSAETITQMPEEVYTSIREAKDVLGVFLLLALWVLLGAATTASCLLGRSHFSGISNQVDAAVRDVAALKCVAIGALNFVLLFLLALALANFRALGIISLLIFLFLVVLTYIGLLSISVTLGEKALALASGESSDFVRIIVGNVILFTAALIPVLGQLFFLYIAFKSFGIGLIWLFRTKILA